MPKLTTRNVFVAWSLGGLLFVLYVLSMAGHFNSGDERFILDTVDSIVNRGDVLTNQTVNLRPLQATTVEPIAYIIPVPLYWLMYNIPWIGTIHGFFLYTPLLTALTAVVLYLFLLDLGYDDEVALFGAVLFGLATIVWPYSKTLFREPLAMLLIFTAAYGLNRWRLGLEVGSPRRWLWLGVGIVFTVLGLFGKEAMLLTLPTLALIAAPLDLKRQRKTLIWTGVGTVAIAIIVVATIALLENTTTIAFSRYELPRRLGTLLQNITYIPQGLAGFLLSPGKSVWAFSPILLLSLAAPILLPRDRWRESWLMLVTLLIFSTVYAGVRGPIWHGGQGWGPRYMVPLIPFLVISAMPAVEALWRNRFGRVGLSILALYSVVVQAAGILLPIEAYSDYLFEQTGQAAWERLAVWTFTWSQPVVALRLIPRIELDLLWLIGSPRPLAIGLLMLLCAMWAGLTAWTYQPRGYKGLQAGALAGTLMVTAAGVLIALSTAWDDPRYRGGRQELHMMLDRLEAEMEEDDVVLLATEGYLPFFLNYYKGEHLWFSSPLSPGERYTCEENINIANTNEDVDQRLADATRLLMDDIRLSHRVVTHTDAPPTVWIVEDIPAAACPTRPTIEYAAFHGFVATTEDIAPDVRITPWVPQPVTFRENNPLYVETRFGEVLQLRLAYLSDREVYPDELLGIGIWWEALQPMSEDYTVSVFMRASDGYTIHQIDREPVGSFIPTSEWVPGQFVIDQYAMPIPDLTPPGTYSIGVTVYRWPSLERLTASRGDVPLTENVIPIGEIVVVAP